MLLSRCPEACELFDESGAKGVIRYTHIKNVHRATYRECEVLCAGDESIEQIGISVLDKKEDRGIGID